MHQVFNPIPTGHGRNQLIYELHVTTAGRNRVKHFVQSLHIAKWSKSERTKQFISFHSFSNKYLIIHTCFIQQFHQLIFFISSFSTLLIFHWSNWARFAVHFIKNPWPKIIQKYRKNRKN